MGDRTFSPKLLWEISPPGEVKFNTGEKDRGYIGDSSFILCRLYASIPVHYASYKLVIMCDSWYRVGWSFGLVIPFTCRSDQINTILRYTMKCENSKYGNGKSLVTPEVDKKKKYRWFPSEVTQNVRRLAFHGRNHIHINYVGFINQDRRGY